MQVTSPIPKQSNGKTFTVAVSILGICALLQLGAVGWAFLLRYKANQRPVPPIAISALPQTPAETRTTVSAPPAPPDAAPTAAPQEVASLPKPTPVPLVTREPELTPEARINEMVEQARALREHGDMSTALTRLREAQTLSSNNALVISEMAITYEKMGLADKASEQWKRIYDMGEAAGIYYAAADAKLKSGLGETTRKEEAIQPGSVLGIDMITATDETDPGAMKKMAIKIPLRCRPNAKIDVHEVTIQVYFYDILNDQNVVQTNANVSSRWTSPPVDWATDNVETLEVQYSQTKNGRGESKFAENRKYYGYIVRLYYKGELQDVRSDPLKLLKDFPPPITLKSEETNERPAR
jgi:hypothetical protein